MIMVNILQTLRSAQDGLRELRKREIKYFKEDSKRNWIFFIVGFWWIIPLFLASLITGFPPISENSSEAAFLQERAPILAETVDIGIFPVRLMADSILQGAVDYSLCKKEEQKHSFLNTRPCRKYFTVQLMPFALTILFWGTLGLICYEIIKKGLTLKEKSGTG